MTASVAALVAALGTLWAKHRPAGSRTRRDDQAQPWAPAGPPEASSAPPADDWELDAYDEPDDELEVGEALGWRPPSRIRAAARALRGR